MKVCKKYANFKGATSAYRTRPVGDCQSCVYFSAKNCGTHHMLGEFSITSSINTNTLIK